MLETNLFLLFTAPLEREAIDYFVTGSIAGIVYGEPRLTNDIDIVLALDNTQAENLASHFPENDFYFPPLENVFIECGRRNGHFNIIHHETGFKADLYLAGDDPLHFWAMQNRKKISLRDGVFWVAPVEYVIIRKLQFFKLGSSEKHIRDIKAIVDNTPSVIHSTELQTQITKLDLVTEWAHVLNFKN